MLDAPEQLLRKIRLGEDSFLECKEMVFAGSKIKGPERKDLADELAAFANAHGGVLILGVEDKSREIVGIPGDRLDAVVRYVTEVARDSIRPSLDPVIERLELPDTTGRAQAVVRIEVVRSLFVQKARPGICAGWRTRSAECSPSISRGCFSSAARRGSFVSTSRGWRTPHSLIRIPP